MIAERRAPIDGVTIVDVRSIATHSTIENPSIGTRAIINPSIDNRQSAIGN